LAIYFISMDMSNQQSVRIEVKNYQSSVPTRVIDTFRMHVRPLINSNNISLVMIVSLASNFANLGHFHMEYLDNKVICLFVSLAIYRSDKEKEMALRQLINCGLESAKLLDACSQSQTYAPKMAHIMAVFEAIQHGKFGTQYHNSMECLRALQAQSKKLETCLVDMKLTIDNEISRAVLACKDA
jgi:hypothetical protein